MRPAHAEAQKMFRLIGELKGYRTTSTFSRNSPTDGVWWEKPPLGIKEIPVVAIEVVNSESLKTLKGSLVTLAEVSPALGILLIHEVDIRRRYIRDGKSAYDVEKLIAKKFADARSHIPIYRQRIEVWSYTQLEYVHKLAKRNVCRSSKEHLNENFHYGEIL